MEIERSVIYAFDSKVLSRDEGAPIGPGKVVRRIGDCAISAPGTGERLIYG